jgi:hypothetical protein
MDQDYKVKGSTIESKFEFTEDNFGTKARQALEDKFRDRGLFPVYPSMWYAYDLYVAVLEQLAETHYGGDLSKLEDVGRYSAKKALESVYRSFVDQVGRDFLDFLSRISQLHKMFYTHGRLEVNVHENGKGCDLIQRDKPSLREADLYVASGFYKEAARIHGIRDMRLSFNILGKDCHFTLSWG